MMTIITENTFSKKIFIFALVALACFLLFWRLGTTPLAEWDESHYGANAIEMIKSGDFVNYSYKNQLDVWNAKPPLLVWSQVFSIKMFGANAFSLRLPSALSILVTIFIIFLYGKSLGGLELGLFYAVTALFTRALVGYHVGRSGDMDGLFVMGLALADYSIRKMWILGSSSKYWLWVALGLIIAFYAKGFAFLLLGPGLFVLFLKQDYKKILRSPWFYAALIFFFMSLGVWFFISLKYGHHDETQKYQGSNSVMVMIVYDVMTRFMGGMDPQESRDPRIILEFLDTRYGALYYWLIIFGSVFLYLKYKKRLEHQKSSLFISFEQRNKDLQYSSIMSLVFLLILGLSKNKLNWYIAPLTLWLPTLTWSIIDLIPSNQKMLRIWATRSLILVLLINFAHVIRSIIAADQSLAPMRDFVVKNQAELNAAEAVYSPYKLKQDEYLYLLWSTQGKITESPVQNQLSRPKDLVCQSNQCKIVY